MCGSLQGGHEIPMTKFGDISRMSNLYRKAAIQWSDPEISDIFSLTVLSVIRVQSALARSDLI